MELEIVPTDDGFSFLLSPAPQPLMEAKIWWGQSRLQSEGATEESGGGKAASRPNLGNGPTAAKQIISNLSGSQFCELLKDRHPSFLFVDTHQMFRRPIQSYCANEK